MADGFALRGFTQGFTQGLQNIDQLATNWQARDLKQKGYELEQQQQERANRYNDYLIKNMERTADRQDRQDALSAETHGLEVESKRHNLDKQQMEMDLLRRKDDANRLYSVLNPDNPESVNITDEDLARMERLGLRPFADYDPSKISAMADRLARGEGLDDPEIMQAVKDAYTVKAQRQLGRGIKPGQQYAATGAETGESVPKPGEMVMPAVKTVVGMKAVDGGFVPIVRVEGATAGDKRYVSYEAPYTENGMSSEEDRPVRVTPQQMADTLRGAGYVSARLQANPALLERLRGQVVSAARGIPEAPTAKDQNQYDQIRSRQFQDKLKAYETQADLAIKDEQAAKLRFENSPENQKLKREYQEAKIRATEASESLRRAREEYTGVQTGNALYGRPGLGSAKSRGGKTGAEKFDAKKAEMWFLNDVYAKDISAANDPQVMRQLPEYKNQIVNMINLGDGQVSQDLAQSILYDAIKQNLPVMKKPFQGKTYRGYAYNGKFYPFAVE